MLQISTSIWPTHQQHPADILNISVSTRDSNIPNPRVKGHVYTPHKPTHVLYFVHAQTPYKKHSNNDRILSYKFETVRRLMTTTTILWLYLYTWTKKHCHFLKLLISLKMKTLCKMSIQASRTSEIRWRIQHKTELDGTEWMELHCANTHNTNLQQLWPQV